MNEEEDKGYKLANPTRMVEKPKEIDKKPEGLRTEVNELKEQIKILVGTQEQKLKKKKFKFPRLVRSKTRNIKKLLEKDKMQVMLLKINRQIKPTIGEIKAGMLIVGNCIYDGSADIVWMWDGKTPTAVVAEWDLKPITPEYLHAETSANQRFIHPENIIIRAMELKEAMMTTKSPNMKTIVYIFIAAIVVGYLIFNKG